MIKVLLIVHRFYDSLDNEFGGTTREFLAIHGALNKVKDIKLTICTDFDIKNLDEYVKEYDVIHCEDNGAYEKMLLAGYYPDIIGPTIKSPYKTEEAKQAWIDKGINPERYFNSVVIRNNNAEDRLDDSWKKIKYIKLGIDTNIWKFSTHTPNRWILWAGDVCREAKNFEMFMNIMKITKLPAGYDWKVLSGYTLEHYKEVLRHTALLINTSFNETFCFAMFEANSMGVPSIYKKDLHIARGHTEIIPFHKDKRIQVEYTPEDYSTKILELLNNSELLEQERKLARQYVEENASIKILGKELKTLYSQIAKKKINKPIG